MSDCRNFEFSEPVLEQVRNIPIDEVRPSPENDELYRPVREDDPDVQALAKSVRMHGIREPLVVSSDGYIISGHRRYCAGRLAGLTLVPVRFDPILRSADPDGFLVLLREHNRQRSKSFDETLREACISMSPDDAHRNLMAHREERAKVDVTPIKLHAKMKRCRISAAKLPLLRSIQGVLEELRPYWPVSVRSVHYNLLNNPPLKHASKPQSLYINDMSSYRALIDVCARGRVFGEIPFEAIEDETRPVTIWNVHPDTGSFLQCQMDEFLTGYWRDLLISQPNHIEVLIEKNTVATFLRNVAARYRVPITSMRGQSSLSPKHGIVERFEASGKERLILLVMSDFDPAGEAIAHSVAKSIEGDFQIPATVVKAGLTFEQVKELNLQTDVEAKSKDPNYKRFVAQYGTGVFELEAVPPATLQSMLAEHLDAVLDTEAFNRELDAEREDARQIVATREQVRSLLKGAWLR